MRFGWPILPRILRRKPKEALPEDYGPCGSYYLWLIEQEQKAAREHGLLTTHSSFAHY